MNDYLEEPTPVTRTLVPEDQRLAVTAELFGAHFPLAIAPVIYGITERMAEAYHGGYWQFYSLDNGSPEKGFYMTPEGDQSYSVVCDNYWQGELSGDALGIVSCLPYGGCCRRHSLRGAFRVPGKTPRSLLDR
jgi:hypothetical protein